jgi:aspartate beta-hydroxylase
MSADAVDLPTVARRAEAQFAATVRCVEQEHGVSLPRLRTVHYTIDRSRTGHGTAQEPYHRSFPALRARPFWSTRDFEPAIGDVLARFTGEFDDLAAEFDAALDPARFLAGNTGYFGDSEDWRHRVVLRQDTTFTDEGRRAHPRLCAVLDSLVELGAARKCYFALMRPGARLANHCGGTNLFLRLHLGVVIPVGDVGIRVGGELRRWTRGGTLVFDDSFGHEAWNHSAHDRYILLLRLVHPDLSAEERALLPTINRSFSATDAARAVDAVLASRQGGQHDA